MDAHREKANVFPPDMLEITVLLIRILEIAGILMQKDRNLAVW